MPPTDIKVRNPRRLSPAERVTVTVTRVDLGVVLLVLMFGALLVFAGGIAAGTSGQWREFVHAITPFDRLKPFREALLVPDRAADGSPGVAQELATLKVSLESRLVMLEEQQMATRRAMAREIETLRDFHPAILNASTRASAASKASERAAAGSADVAEALNALSALVYGGRQIREELINE